MIRLAIIGTGGMAHAHSGNFMKIPGVKLVAACDVVEKKAAEFAAKYGIPATAVFTNVDKLLKSVKCDAVTIVATDAWHAPIALKCIAAGKHVLCEKPLTRHPAEIETVWGLAESRGLQVAEAFMWRHIPQTKRFAELVVEGAIGELQFVRSLFSFAMSDPRTNVRMKREWEGGSLMDVGTYCVSGIRLIAGEPVAVYGEQVLGGAGVDVRFSGLMRYESGARALFYSSFETPGRKELEAIGSEGVLRLRDPWHAWRGGIELQREEENGSETIEVETGDAYLLELEDFARSIRGEKEPLLGRLDALGQARALAALYLSAEQERPVELAEMDREV
jgi:predicted dehydrogenase